MLQLFKMCLRNDESLTTQLRIEVSRDAWSDACIELAFIWRDLRHPWIMIVLVASHGLSHLDRQAELNS